MSAVDLATVTADIVEGWPSEGFRLTLGDRDIPLALVDIRRADHGDRVGGAFALTFLAPVDRALPQAMYAVSHPEIGRLDLFLVPIGPVQGGNGFEAVFN